MSTKKKPRAKPAPKAASAKASPMKAGAAKVRHLAAKTAARPADAASSARPAAPPSAPGPASAATHIASESLLTLITANLAALREQITAGGGKRAHAAAAKGDKNLVEAVERLKAGYRKLLRSS
jgi:hypothetical protein